MSTEQREMPVVSPQHRAWWLERILEEVPESLPEERAVLAYLVGRIDTDSVLLAPMSHTEMGAEIWDDRTQWKRVTESVRTLRRMGLICTERAAKGHWIRLCFLAAEPCERLLALRANGGAW